MIDQQATVMSVKTLQNTLIVNEKNIVVLTMDIFKFKIHDCL